MHTSSSRRLIWMCGRVQVCRCVRVGSPQASCYVARKQTIVSQYNWHSTHHSMPLAPELAPGSFFIPTARIKLLLSHWQGSQTGLRGAPRDIRVSPSIRRPTFVGELEPAKTFTYLFIYYLGRVLPQWWKTTPGLFTVPGVLSRFEICNKHDSCTGSLHQFLLIMKEFLSKIGFF